MAEKKTTTTKKTATPKKTAVKKTPEPVKIENEYKAGHIYMLEEDSCLRAFPYGPKKKVYECAVPVKDNAYMDRQGNAILKKGTRIQALDVVNDGSSVWLLTISGYICAKDVYDKRYVIGG